jgi:hypothetical protein
MTAVSRRQAFLSAAAAGGALTLPLTALTYAQPDAGTMALIARFMHLEHYRRALYEPSPLAIEDDGERDQHIKGIYEAQEDIADQLEDRPIRSMQELSALIGAALLWYPDLVSEVFESGMDGRILRIACTALAPDAVAEAEWRMDHLQELSAGDQEWLRVNGGAA